MDMGPQAFRKDDSGLLLPFHGILTAQQPEAPPIVKETKIPAHISRKDGKVTDIPRSVSEFGYDEAVKHYEEKTGKSMTLTPGRRRKMRDMVSKAADMAVKG